MTSSSRACSTPATPTRSAPPPRIRPRSSRGTGKSAGRASLYARVRLERGDGRVEVAGDVDVVRRVRRPGEADDPHPAPRLQALVGELGEDPPVAGVRDGVEGGETDGAMVRLVDHPSGEPVGIGLADDDLGATQADLARDVPPQRRAVLDDARRASRRSRRARPRRRWAPARSSPSRTLRALSGSIVSIPASPLVRRKYVTSAPAAVHRSTAAASPYSMSSGCAATHSTDPKPSASGSSCSSIRPRYVSDLSRQPFGPTSVRRLSHPCGLE